MRESPKYPKSLSITVSLLTLVTTKWTDKEHDVILSENFQCPFSTTYFQELKAEFYEKLNNWRIIYSLLFLWSSSNKRRRKGMSPFYVIIVIFISPFHTHRNFLFDEFFGTTSFVWTHELLHNTAEYSSSSYGQKINQPSLPILSPFLPSLLNVSETKKLAQCPHNFLNGETPPTQGFFPVSSGAFDKEGWKRKPLNMIRR